MGEANFMDAVIENGFIYFFDNILQAMCRADLKNYNLEILAEYNDYKEIEVNQIYSFDHFFLLIDIFSISILWFDRDRKCYVNYEYDLENRLRQGHSSFLLENLVYFFPVDNHKNIVCFDIKSQEFFQVDSINNLLGKNINSFCLAPTMYKDIVYFAIQRTNQYIEYNLFTKRAQIVNFKNIGTKLYSLLQTDELMTWILEDKSLGLVCGEKEKCIIKISNEQQCSRICNIQNYVCLPPRCGNRLILIDKFNMDIKNIVLPVYESELILTKNKRSGFVKCIETESDIFVIPFGIKALLCITKDTFKVSRIRFQCNNYMNMVISRRISLAEKVAERQEVNMCHFMEYIRSHSISETRQSYVENVGGSIWDAI